METWLFCDQSCGRWESLVLLWTKYSCFHVRSVDGVAAGPEVGAGAAVSNQGNFFWAGLQRVCVVYVGLGMVTPSLLQL